MRNLCLLSLLVLTAISVPASAQNSASRGTAPQFPGLRVRLVDHTTVSPGFAPQAGGAIIDESESYAVGDQYYEDDYYGGMGELPADCGYGCPSAWTAEIEGIYFNREGDDRFSASTAFVLSDFDYEPGARVTLRRHFDCLEGFDITYTGGFDWVERGQVSGAGLNSVFGATGVDISTFNGATLHTQAYRSTLDSVELMRKWYGWDVFAVGFGVRYFNIEEDYAFRSVSGLGNGSLDVETNNNMGGLQLSLEMKIPLGSWTTKTRIKGGLMGNVADAQTVLTNAGATQIANQSDDIEFASIVEFGYYQRYRVSENVSLQGGYEVWWLYGLAVAPDQVPAILTPATGSSVDGQGDTWYHGASFGVEVVY